MQLNQLYVDINENDLFCLVRKSGQSSRYELHLRCLFTLLLLLMIHMQLRKLDVFAILKELHSLFYKDNFIGTTALVLAKTLRTS